MCGFDEPMLRGLEEFYLGLERAVNIRADGDLPAAIKKELDDIESFDTELRRLPDNVCREQLEGLVKLGRSLYNGVLRRAASGEAYEDAFRNERQETTAMLKAVDDHYYGELESKLEEPMPALVDWIAEKYS